MASSITGANEKIELKKAFGGDMKLLQEQLDVQLPSIKASKNYIITSKWGRWVIELKSVRSWVGGHDVYHGSASQSCIF